MGFIISFFQKISEKNIYCERYFLVSISEDLLTSYSEDDIEENVAGRVFYLTKISPFVFLFHNMSLKVN